MSTSNWPGNVDRSLPNWTLRTPRESRYPRYRTWAECDGKGAYAKGKTKIPAMAWVYAAVVIALFFGVAHVGAAAGF